MKILFILMLSLLPCTAFAEDCQVVEYPDRFDVTCTGDPKPVQIPRQAVTSAPMQATTQAQVEELQKTPPQPESAATAPAGDAAKAVAGPAARKPGRQGRPNSADMQAAIEARRKLIQDLKPKD